MGDTSLVDQSSSNGDCGSVWVDTCEFWHDEGEDGSINSDIKVLGQELSDIEGVSGVVSRGKQCVDEVFSNVDLSLFSSSVSKFKSGWVELWVE